MIQEVYSNENRQYFGGIPTQWPVIVFVPRQRQEMRAKFRREILYHLLFLRLSHIFTKKN